MKKDSKIDAKQKKQILIIILDGLMRVGLFGIFAMMFSGVGAFIEHFFDK